MNMHTHARIHEHTHTHSSSTMCAQGPLLCLSLPQGRRSWSLRGRGPPGRCSAHTPAGTRWQRPGAGPSRAAAGGFSKPEPGCQGWGRHSAATSVRQDVPTTPSTPGPGPPGGDRSPQPLLAPCQRCSRNHRRWAWYRYPSPGPQPCTLSQAHPALQTSSTWHRRGSSGSQRTQRRWGWAMGGANVGGGASGGKDREVRAGPVGTWAGLVWQRECGRGSGEGNGAWPQGPGSSECAEVAAVQNRGIPVLGLSTPGYIRRGSTRSSRDPLAAAPTAQTVMSHLASSPPPTPAEVGRTGQQSRGAGRSSL